MKVVKKFDRDERTELVSRVFDQALMKNDYPLPFNRLEFHIRDRDVTLFEEDMALICIDYNNPFILEMDERGIAILIRHELFRLTLRLTFPRLIEDVIVGKELIKRGFGDEIFYMYYNLLMKSKHEEKVHSFIRASVPWTIFYGLDNYNSKFLKDLVSKLYKRKFPETKKLFLVLCKLSGNNMRGAVKEYESLM
jgi:hypothetical protein